MKKVLLGFLSIILLGTASYAQPVSDMAVIPMGITIQSIMRLNIKRGGNIEFVFNKLSDLTNGIVNAPNYDTYFDVAASQNWDLNLGTDIAAFTADDGTTIPLDRVDLNLETVAGNAETVVAAAYDGVYGPLVNPIALLTYSGAAAPATNVGDAAANDYIIHWQCGVTTSVSGFPAGRYALNIYLSLVAD